MENNELKIRVSADQNTVVVDEKKRYEFISSNEFSEEYRSMPCELCDFYNQCASDETFGIEIPCVDAQRTDGLTGLFHRYK